MDYPPLIDADPNDTETPFFVKTVESMMRLLQVDEVTATTILAHERGEIEGDAIGHDADYEPDDSDLVTDEG